MKKFLFTLSSAVKVAFARMMRAFQELRAWLGPFDGPRVANALMAAQAIFALLALFVTVAAFFLARAA